MPNPNPYASPLAATNPPPTHAPTGKFVWRAVFWNVTVTCGSLFVGAASHLLRPWLDFQVHYDALGALALTYALCILLLNRFWRFPILPGIFAMNVGVLAIWLGMFMGWIAISYLDRRGGEYYYDRFMTLDMLGILAINWFISALVGSVILLLPHHRHAPPGPTAASD